MNTDLEAGRSLAEHSDNVPPRKQVVCDRLLAEDTAGASVDVARHDVQEQELRETGCLGRVGIASDTKGRRVS